MPEPQTGRIGGGVLQDNLELYQGGAGKPNLNFKNTASNTALLHLDPVTGRIGIDLENPSKDLTVKTKFRSENLNSDRTEVFPLFTIENNTVGVDTDILYLTATPTEAYTINWEAVALETLRTAARIVVPLTDFLLSAAPDGYLYGDIDLKLPGATPGVIPFGSYPPVNSTDSGLLFDYGQDGTTGNATYDERLETVFVPALTELFETDPATYGYVFTKYDTDPNIQLSALATSDILIDDEKITTYNSNANLDLIPSGTGTVEFLNNVDIYGSMNATGNISMGGDLIFGTGPETPDEISFDTQVQSNIVPDVDNTYNLGSSDRRLGEVHTNLLNGAAVNAGEVISGFVNINTRVGNMFYVSQNGNDTNVGDHVQGPFRTVRRALEAADASGEGTVTVHIFAGEYEEELPLIVPDNVTVKGEEIRNTIIKPAAGYENQDVFKLNDNSTVEDLTVKDFYTGAAFSFANNAIISTRSPYVRNVTVITKGTETAPPINFYAVGNYIQNLSAAVSSAVNGPLEPFLTTQSPSGYLYGDLNLTRSNPYLPYYDGFGSEISSADARVAYTIASYITPGSSGYEPLYYGPGMWVYDEFRPALEALYLSDKATYGEFFLEDEHPDPRFFESGDAGKGAVIDGSVLNASSPSASMLFHSATFITPGVDALTMTNGVRVEWLNSFTYFADRGLYASNGVTGRISPDGSTVNYGAELRSIGSANVYGNYGAVADGSDCIMYLIQHNFAYIGTQYKVDNDPNDVIEEQQWDDLNGGKIYVTNTDEKGKFKVGNEFFVDLESGLLSIDAEDVTLDGLSQIIISNGTDQTTLNTSFVETGNIRFEGETMYSLISDLNIDSVTSTTNFNSNVLFDKNTDIVGDLSISGELIRLGNDPNDTVDLNVNIEQDFYPDQDRTYSLGSNSKVWNDVYADNIVIDDIQIFDTTITTTVSDANLNLQSNGAGYVEIEGIRFRENTITTTDATNIEFTTSNNLIVEGEGLRLPVGTNDEIIEDVGILRFSSEDNVFEGFGDGRISFDGIYSDDRRTSIIANDTNNYIDLNINAIKVGEINNEGITLHGLQSDSVLINNNEITSSESNADLWIRRKGTGTVTLNNQEYFRNTTWTNPSAGAFEIISGENGYVKAGGTLAAIIGLAGTVITDNVNTLSTGTDISASSLWESDNGVRIAQATTTATGNGTATVTNTQIVGSTNTGSQNYFIDFGIDDISDVIDIELSQIRFRGNFQDTNEYVDITLPSDDTATTYLTRIGVFEDNGNTTDWTVSGVFGDIPQDTRTYSNTGTEASIFPTQVIVGGSGNYGINVEVTVPSSLNTLVSGMTNNWELEIQYKITTNTNQFVEYEPSGNNYYYMFDEDTSILPNTTRYAVTDSLDLSNFTSARFKGKLILGDGSNGSRLYEGNDINFEFSYDGSDDSGMVTITPIMEIENRSEFVIWKDFEITFNIEDSTVDFSNIKFRISQNGTNEKGLNAFAVTDLVLAVSEDSGPGPEVGAFRYNPSIKGVEVWNNVAWIPGTGIEEDPVTEDYMREEVSLWSILLG